MWFLQHSYKLLLGSKPHNGPLFLIGYIKEQKVNHILVDVRVSVNIMSKFTIYDLGIMVKELTKSQTII